LELSGALVDSRILGLAGRLAPGAARRDRGEEQALYGFREALHHWVVSPLQGVTFPTWRRIVTDPRIEIDPRYRPRILATGLASLVNSLQARIEERRFGGRARSVRVEAPVFILGHYRSGTTHLHNLLAVDSRFAFSNYYQATFPNTFLTTERIGSRLGFLSIDKRPHDDVALGVGAPAEDEIALCSDTLLSPHMGWHFPKRAGDYERYLTFRDVTRDERERFKQSMARFARKLTLKYDRPLVFKSPCHTARIRLILETFPDARFIHIHRDPFTVFQSTRNMERKVGPLFQFQRRDLSLIDEAILSRYRRTYAAYLEDRGLIPPARLVELSYESLTRDPLRALQTLYAHHGFPPFESVRADVKRYLSGINGYRTNEYGRLEPGLAERIVREWGPFFGEWVHAGGASPRIPASTANR